MFEKLGNTLATHYKESGQSLSDLALELGYRECDKAFLSDVARLKHGAASLERLHELAERMDATWNYHLRETLHDVVIVPPGHKATVTKVRERKPRKQRKPMYRPVCSQSTKTKVEQLGLTVDEIVDRYIDERQARKA